MLILGLNAYHPDSSACIIRDGQLVAAAEEERFRRIKHWSGLPVGATAYCLKEAGASFTDLDFIACNRNPVANIHKKLIYALGRLPSPRFIGARFLNIAKIGNIESSLRKALAVQPPKKHPRLFNVEHHRAHLASAFFVSQFNRAAVLSLDGFGDFSSCMGAIGEVNRLRPVFQINYPHSLGIFYTAFTQFLGFEKFGDEYKVMGLAAYGKPRFADKMKRVLSIGERGFRLNQKFFSLSSSSSSMSWDNTEPALGRLYSPALLKEFGPARGSSEELTEFHCDLAASLQSVYEEAFFAILNRLYRLSKLDDLCLAGGCALNSLANGKIFERTPFKEVFIQPAAGDAGGSLGAAFYLYNQLLGAKRSFVMRHAYWGPSFSDSDIRELISSEGQLKAGAYTVRELDEGSLCRTVALLISEGKIAGWFQGRMEWGARALGNRSILVDPRRKEMKDILNERIKRREWFRPFAPAIKEERAADYFECSYPDPFMIKVYPIKKEKRASIAAVTHVDGTGRLQTVSKDTNPLFWKLLSEFENITGIPVLLNTSFNENEPIVCSPREALGCFLRTRMDLLVLGRSLVLKSK